MVMLFKQAGIWWFTFCLICYKITDISNRVSESILGNPQNRAESLEAQTARTISDWTLLLLLERNFSASGRCKSELVLASDSGSPESPRGTRTRVRGWFSVRKNTCDTYSPHALGAVGGYGKTQTKGGCSDGQALLQVSGSGAKSDNSFCS